MTDVRKGAAIAAAIVLLVSLAGCSAAVHNASTTSAVAATPPSPTATIPVPVSTPIPAPAAPPPAAAVAAPAPAPVAKAVAAAPASPTSAACVGTPAGTKHIYVSITQQHLWACTGGVLLLDTAVTTGASALTNVNDATPVGTFYIRNKVRNTVLAGHDVNGAWHDPVTFWMPFTGGIGFHDSPWQTFPLGSQLYKTQGSHGCIHVPLGGLTTLFSWAPIGTAVIVRS